MKTLAEDDDDDVKEEQDDRVNNGLFRISY